MNSTVELPNALLRLRAQESLHLVDLSKIVQELIEHPGGDKLLCRDDWTLIAMPLMSSSGALFGSYAAKVAMNELAEDPRVRELIEQFSRGMRDFALGLDAGRPVHSSLRAALDLFRLIEEVTERLPGTMS